MAPNCEMLLKQQTTDPIDDGPDFRKSVILWNMVTYGTIWYPWYLFWVPSIPRPDVRNPWHLHLGVAEDLSAQYAEPMERVAGDRRASYLHGIFI